MQFVAVHESPIGTLRTLAIKPTVSAHRGKADLAAAFAKGLAELGYLVGNNVTIVMDVRLR